MSRRSDAGAGATISSASAPTWRTGTPTSDLRALRRRPGPSTARSPAWGWPTSSWAGCRQCRARRTRAARSDQRYLGLYAQDAWRATNRVTVNAGLRWEPYLRAELREWRHLRSSRSTTSAGVKSTRVRERAGRASCMPGDAGFPPRQPGMNRQWWNLSPRVGVAWDVTAMAAWRVRSSYALEYDFPAGDSRTLSRRRPPFGNRSLDRRPGRSTTPIARLGGDPHPIVTGPRHGVPGPRRVRRRSIRTSTRRASSRGTSPSNSRSARTGACGQLSGQLLGSPVGPVPLNPASSWGSAPARSTAWSYPVVHDDREPEPAARARLENPR